PDSHVHTLQSVNTDPSVTLSEVWKPLVTLLVPIKFNILHFPHPQSVYHLFTPAGAREGRMAHQLCIPRISFCCSPRRRWPPTPQGSRKSESLTATRVLFCGPMARLSALIVAGSMTA